jgi:hypothetical protein
MPGPLSSAYTVTKLPAQDIERARAFTATSSSSSRSRRARGLRYVCGPTEFHLFSSAGVPSGESTQMAFEVENLDATVADLRVRGVTFERFRDGWLRCPRGQYRRARQLLDQGQRRAWHVLLGP